MASDQGPGPLREGCGGASPLSEEEQQVVRDTEEVFQSYVYHRHQQDRADDPEMDTLSPGQGSTLTQVGCQLAIIGDDINRRYGSDIEAMLQQLQPTADNAPDLFYKIACSCRVPLAFGARRSAWTLFMPVRLSGSGRLTGGSGGSAAHIFRICSTPKRSALPAPGPVLTSSVLSSLLSLGLQASSGTHSLFKPGPTWGRVVALLAFGYRLALHVYQQHGLSGFLGKVTRLVVDSMLQLNVVRWIVEKGGWVAALDWAGTFRPIWTVVTAFAIVMVGQYVIRRFFKSS
nr:bcl-2 homologous antagonist/killer isoform X1 [Cavia porcellus]